MLEVEASDLDSKDMKVWYDDDDADVYIGIEEMKCGIENDEPWGRRGWIFIPHRQGHDRGTRH